ncbi:hypothetical protein V6N13_146409 [Hibiscus sabdariffa]
MKRKPSNPNAEAFGWKGWKEKRGAGEIQEDCSSILYFGLGGYNGKTMGLEEYNGREFISAKSTTTYT